jgi:hypothetical protein
LILFKPEDNIWANGKSKRERKRGKKKERGERLVLSQSGGNTA